MSSEENVGKIVEMVEGLTALELAALAKALSEKFGVTPMAAMPMGAAVAGGRCRGGSRGREDRVRRGSRRGRATRSSR